MSYEMQVKQNMCHIMQIPIFTCIIFIYIYIYIRYTSQVIFAFAHERAILSRVILRDSELLSRERTRRSCIIARYLSCKLTNLTYVRAYLPDYSN